MTGSLPFEANLAGKKILITGDSGFTGAWASLWLNKLGAQVIGCSLAPTTSPSMSEAVMAAEDKETNICDIRDFEALTALFDRSEPDLVLHLAAQALVRKSYRNPLETFAVNTQGTANVLEAARNTPSVKCILCVTTDKVYKNNEWAWGYRENDALGGKDPYSASKSAAEVIISSYMDCFAKVDNGSPRIAVARGGNIIGGGDWAEDRLIPDFVRSVIEKSKLVIRYPDATRPWQHVLALVQGYLMILSGLLTEPAKYSGPWNLGPNEDREYSVKDVFDLLSRHWARPEIEYMKQPLPEAKALALDSTRARDILGWRPAWDTRRSIMETANWYRAYYDSPAAARSVTEAQIEDWRNLLKSESAE